MSTFIIKSVPQVNLTTAFSPCERFPALQRDQSAWAWEVERLIGSTDHAFKIGRVFVVTEDKAVGETGGGAKAKL